jgi:hypothetical protein
MEEFKPRPLEGVSNILDSQDNGYKNTVSALSELIDNSIQAEAKEIQIILVEKSKKQPGAKKRITISDIYIIDDGMGMTAEAFSSALQASSGTRSGASKGLGKYGQGLPQASRSQTIKTEIFSKTSSRDYWFYDRMDLAEIHDSGKPELSNAKSIRSIEDPFIKKYFGNLLTGTVVKWCDVNRVKPKMSSTLISHALPQLGRTFRYFLNGEAYNAKTKLKLRIRVFGFDEKLGFREDKQKDVNVTPYDPLFLSSEGQFVVKFPLNNHPTSYLYAEVTEKLEFYSRDETEKLSDEIKVKFSIVKKEERFMHGRNAGSTDFGKEYLYRGLKQVHSTGYCNISVLREYREIDTGSFGFIGNINDPRHRWWSIELHIPPSMDHVFGVGNKKQHAHKFSLIEANDAELDFNDLVLKQVSNLISGNLTSMLEDLKDQGTGPKPPKQPGGRPEGIDTEPGSPGGGDTIDDELVKETMEWLKNHRKRQDFKESQLREIVDFALSTPDKHIFLVEDLGPVVLFEHKVIGDKVLIELNQSHRLFRSFLAKYEDDPNIKRTIRIMIGAFVNSLIKSNDKTSEYSRISKKLKNKFAMSLEEYLDVMYPNEF